MRRRGDAAQTRIRYLPFLLRDPRLIRAPTSCDDGASVGPSGSEGREADLKKDALHIHDAAVLQLKTHRAEPKA